MKHVLTVANMASAAKTFRCLARGVTDDCEDGSSDSEPDWGEDAKRA